ncbi:hypothetical protein E2C01_064005 [Portunus trituberculatus]|uniref:Uncharacterized protein n=1 Tax=Portunus trituberculatus TaxID=210409 RepID=A0A5B7HML2_PORTR|nr:hypothetical protein [Portunus trituberculatus]
MEEVRGGETSGVEESDVRRGETWNVLLCLVVGRTEEEEEEEEEEGKITQKTKQDERREKE